MATFSPFVKYRVVPYSKGGGASIDTLFTTTVNSLVSVQPSVIGVIGSFHIYWSTTSFSYRTFFNGDPADAQAGLTQYVPAGQPIRVSKNGNVSGTIHVWELE